MTKYVLGFMFSDDLKRVALIRKNKPAWQSGKLNGIGGKVEDSDNDEAAAMLREFEEEAGAVAVWYYYGRMHGQEWSVALFACRGDLGRLISCTAEAVEVWPVTLAGAVIVENLTWLVAAAIDYLEDGRPMFIDVRYP